MPRGVHRRKYGRIDCPACLRRFTRKRPNQEYCSAPCRRAAPFVSAFVRAIHLATRHMSREAVREATAKREAKRAQARP
jgi:hypothetical protein